MLQPSWTAIICGPAGTLDAAHGLAVWESMTLSDQHTTHDRPPGNAHNQSTARSALLFELREHTPFSVSAVAIGLIVAGAICILGSQLQGVHGVGAESQHAGHEHGPVFAGLFFHLFHPAHMLFSAAATTAMFFRYERRIAKAVVVGLAGAVGVCGISDIVVPHLSLAILGAKTPWHICVLEHPALALPFAAVGVLIGIATAAGVSRSTLISHSLHVFASTMASIFYMVGPLGLVAWIDDLGKVLIFVILAVMVPCCLSDIVFPMLMTHADRHRYHADAHTCH